MSLPLLWRPLFLALFWRLATMKLRRISWFQTAFAGTMGTSAAAASILWLFLFNPSVGLASFASKALEVSPMPIYWLIRPVP